MNKKTETTSITNTVQLRYDELRLDLSPAALEAAKSGHEAQKSVAHDTYAVPAQQESVRHGITTISILAMCGLIAYFIDRVASGAWPEGIVKVAITSLVGMAAVISAGPTISLWFSRSSNKK